MTVLTTNEILQESEWQKHQLTFLDFILRNSSLTLFKTQLELLWDTMVVMSRTRDEVERTFLWLTTQLNSHTEEITVFEAEAVTHLFTTKMTTMDFPNLAAPGFAMFETFFFHINEREKKIVPKEPEAATGVSTDSGSATPLATSQVVAPPPPSSVLDQSEDMVTPRLKRGFEVLAFTELVGLDALWQIALRAESEQVAKAAVGTLTSLVGNISALKKKIRTKYREHFVLNCVRHIKTALDESNGTPPDAANARIVGRSLTLLRIFIEGLQTPLAQGSSGNRKAKTHKRNKSGSIVGRLISARDKPLPLEVVVIQRRKKTVAFELTVSTADTLATLKAAILARPESETKKNSLKGSAERVHDDRDLQQRASAASHMRLFSNGMEYKDYTRTLQDLEFFEDQTIYAYLVEDDDDDDDDDDLEVVISEVLNAEEEAAAKKGSGSGRSKRKLKKRSIDSSWLEAMQQQLHAIGVSRAGPLFNSAPSSSPPTTSAGSSTGSLGGGSSDRDEDLRSSLLLTSQEHFDQLYNLLKLPDPIAQRTIQLLKLLPLNPGILERFRTIQNPEVRVVDWQNLLNTADTYQLMYVLHVVNHLVKENALPFPQTEQGRLLAWRRRFIMLGGVTHLLRLFASLARPGAARSSQVQSRAAAEYGCLAYIFEILTYTIFDYGNNEASSIPTNSTLSAALHSVIPLVFNCLKLPAALSQADVAHLVPSIALGTFRQQVEQARQEQQAREQQQQQAETLTLFSLPVMAVPSPLPSPSILPPSSQSPFSLLSSISTTPTVASDTTEKDQPSFLTITTTSSLSPKLSQRTLSDDGREDHSRGEPVAEQQRKETPTPTPSPHLAPDRPDTPNTQLPGIDLANENLFVVDAVEFIAALVDVTKRMTTPEAVAVIGEDINLVVKHGLRLFVGCCKSFIELISFNDEFYDWVLWLVLRCKDAAVREEAILTFENLCKYLYDWEGGKYRGAIWGMIFSLLSQLDHIERHENQSIQCLKLLSRLVSSYGSSWPATPEPTLATIPPSFPGYQQPEKVFSTLCSLVKAHPVRETAINVPQGYEDGVIIGLLTLLSSFCSSIPTLKSHATRSIEGLLGTVFFRCLFEIPSSSK